MHSSLPPPFLVMQLLRFFPILHLHVFSVTRKHFSFLLDISRGNHKVSLQNFFIFSSAMQTRDIWTRNISATGKETNSHIAESTSYPLKKYCLKVETKLTSKDSQ